MWLVHWRRKAPEGPTYAKWDCWLRYALITLFVVTGLVSLATDWPIGARWLALKLLLFTAGIGCGIAVRY